MTTTFSMKAIAPEDQDLLEERHIDLIDFDPIARRETYPRRNTSGNHDDEALRDRLSEKRKRLCLGLSAIVEFGGMVLKDDTTEILEETHITEVDVINKWAVKMKNKIQVEGFGNSHNDDTQGNQGYTEKVHNDDSTSYCDNDVLELESDDDDAAAVVDEDIQMEDGNNVQGHVSADLFPHYIDCEKLHDADFIEIQCTCGCIYEIVSKGSNFFVRTNTDDIVTPADGRSSNGQIILECNCKRVSVIKKTGNRLEYATYVR